MKVNTHVNIIISLPKNRIKEFDRMVKYETGEDRQRTNFIERKLIGILDNYKK